MRIPVQLFLALNTCLQSTGFAAEILCVDELVPREFVARALVTEESKKTIAREYQKLLGVSLPDQAVCTTVAIVGVIKTGDFDALTKVYRASKGWLGNVSLVSHGGNLNEGMRIGQLIRKGLLSTSAPAKLSKAGEVFMVGGLSMRPNPCANRDCVCASTCFVIWVAGSHRSGNYLGIHRPTFETEYFGDMPPREAERVYERAIQDLGQYLKDMNVPQVYYEQLMKTPSWEVLIPWESIKNDLESPLHGLSAAHNSPAIDEWLAARCGSIQAEELIALQRYDFETLFKYGLMFGSPSRWSQVPDPAYRSLAKKIHEITSCRVRSGSVCLNNFPRFISGLRADWQRCRVVHGGVRRLRRTQSRSGQLGAHRGFHLKRPASIAARWPGTFPAA